MAFTFKKRKTSLPWSFRARERTERLIGLKEIPAWIHSPAGLPIGAQGPEEIAISIMAEMVQHLHQPHKPARRYLWTVPE
ncbi:XdhC family protein [Neobacillus sp. PS3-34]|uniref:XdhC family protein n=1 Tax=Neobacillus sp. PS3-34 TaxID=3070678 RepID=UPI0035A660F7